MEIRNEIRPVDKNNMDGQRGVTAVPVDWPVGLSRKATQALLYLDGAVFLFLYRGEYIITDESGWRKWLAYGIGQGQHLRRPQGRIYEPGQGWPLVGKGSRGLG